MSFTIVIFVTRNPSLTTAQFKEHWETVHVPLLQHFSGIHFPPRFVRRYLARTNRKGFGSPANPDNPPLVLRGIPGEFDYDGIAELTFESEQTFQEFYKSIYQKEAAATLAADEAKFLDTTKTKAVVVDETRSTYSSTGSTIQ